MSIKEIKRNARIKLGESIKGDNLVFLAFAFRVSFTIIAIISLANRWYGFNNIIIGLIISLQIPYIPLYYSFKRKVLKISKEANDTNYDYGDFLYYYKHNPLTVIAVELMQNLFLFLWAFTIVGVFIKAFSYSMTSYLKIENEELSARDAIKKSMEIMNGHKLKLFRLYLSFIGYYLLAILTLGAIYPFVRVYLEMCVAEFYNYIKRDSINLEDNEQNTMDNNLIKNEEIVYGNANSNVLKNKTKIFVATILLSIATFTGFNLLNNTITRNQYKADNRVEVIKHNKILDLFTIHIREKEKGRSRFHFSVNLW